MIRGELANLAERLRADRVPFVAATVVHAQRPTSVQMGDAALVLADGTIEGFVGGSCAQASVRLHAARALESGQPRLLRLIPGDAGSGTGSEEPDGTVVERNPCLSGGSIEVLLEPQLPAPRVVVVGDAPIARALESVARAAGYDAVLVHPAEASPTSSDAAVIVASHGSGEEPVLVKALTEGVGYVALVCSRVRGEAVREALDLPEDLRRRLHAPAGLAIGARSPAEIAIAILAELVAEVRAKPAEAPARAPAAVPPPVATALDPVCGMEVVAADTSCHVDAGAERVYFCSERCRSTYAERLASAAGPA